jgi:hypothetical protein
MMPVMIAGKPARKPQNVMLKIPETSATVASVDAPPLLNPFGAP